MEFWLLVKVGTVIDNIVRAGYLLAGGYIVRTGVRYVKDYNYYSEKEKTKVE